MLGKRAERETIKMKLIYDNNETSAKLAGVEKEIKKALFKIYKEYTKVAGQENKIYVNMSITTEDDSVIIAANNSYFDDGSFDSKNPLRLWEEYEK